MSEIGMIIHGDQIRGIKSLFINSYIHYAKSINFYKKIEKEKRLRLIENIAKDLSKKCKLLVYVDSEDSNVVYSVIAYTLEQGKLVVYFSYTKYPFRGYGFCKKLLSKLEEDSTSLSHCVPIKLGGYEIWKKYNQQQPYYPKI